MSIVRPILEYGASCWDPYREGQINALDHVEEERLNLQIVRTIRCGKLWCSVESQLAFAPSSKHTPDNRYGNL